MIVGFECLKNTSCKLVLSRYVLIFILLKAALIETAGKPCTRNSINLGNIINTLLKDYDTHILPNEDGVNVTIEMHVQVSFSL